MRALLCFIAIFMLLLCPTLAVNDVIVKYNKLFVGGMEYIVKGISYSPMPLGLTNQVRSLPLFVSSPLTRTSGGSVQHPPDVRGQSVPLGVLRFGLLRRVDVPWPRAGAARRGLVLAHMGARPAQDGCGTHASLGTHSHAH